MRFIRNATLTGMDGHAPSLEKARQNRTHNEYFLGYVEALERAFPGRRFDACVALDLIEHLDKEDGRRFLSQVEAIATKKVVIFTPNGFLPQRSHDGDLQEHLSGWTTAEMRSFGYHVQGMGGPKSLRGEYHVIRYRPRFFWSMLSLLWHFGYTRSHPEASAALLCCRTVRKED